MPGNLTTLILAQVFIVELKLDYLKLNFTIDIYRILEHSYLFTFSSPKNLSLGHDDKIS